MKLRTRLDWQALVARSRLFRCALPIAAGCLVVAAGCLMRWPEWRQLQHTAQANQKALDDKHQAKAAEVSARVHAPQALSDAQRHLDDMRWRLAAGGEISDLLDQLAASGHVHGLHFERLEVLDEQNQPGFGRTPLDVQVVGRYAALRMWLDDWLGQVRLLRAGDMHLASAHGRPGVLRLRLRVDAFHADGAVAEPESLAWLPARDHVRPAVADPFSGWSGRAVKQGLANIPLAQLEMVGSLSRGMQHEALLLSAGRLYRVRAGDRLGRDEGVVVRVDAQQVEVCERLFVGGIWRERTTVLTLRKGVDREITRDNERDDEVAGGGLAADAFAGSDALSG
ncbi:pilus assembly protein PilP [Pseudomonas sp. NPDC089758]|uniref:pilus assembly protein PilP n=1 Tax=Pseudomonas sp. NPDC089758 TaxID=3364473 RepID=UPI0037FE4FCA